MLHAVGLSIMIVCLFFWRRGGLCSLSATVHLFHNVWGRWGCWWLLKVKYGKVLMWDYKMEHWGEMQTRVSARQPWFHCHFKTRLPFCLRAVFPTWRRREKETAVKPEKHHKSIAVVYIAVMEHIVKSIKWHNEELWVWRVFLSLLWCKQFAVHSQSLQACKYLNKIVVMGYLEQCNFFFIAT